MFKIKSGRSASKEFVKKFEENLTEKLIPDFESGFFPHFVEDLSADFWAGLMPKLDDLNKASDRYTRKTHGELTINQALKQINTYADKHAKKRASKKQFKYSPNFMLSISDYLMMLINLILLLI